MGRRVDIHLRACHPQEKCRIPRRSLSNHFAATLPCRTSNSTSFGHTRCAPDRLIGLSSTPSLTVVIPLPDSRLLADLRRLPRGTSTASGRACAFAAAEAGSSCNCFLERCTLLGQSHTELIRGLAGRGPQHDCALAHSGGHVHVLLPHQSEPQGVVVTEIVRLELEGGVRIQ